MFEKIREILCRHHYEAVACDTPGWEFEQCVKCGRLTTVSRPGGTITVHLNRLGPGRSSKGIKG